MPAAWIAVSVCGADHRRIFPCQRAFDRRLRRVERRAAVRRIDAADFELGALQLLSMNDLQTVERKPAKPCVFLERAAIADQHRLAHLPHCRIVRGLDRDLRPDAAGVTGSDGESAACLQPGHQRGVDHVRHALPADRLDREVHVLQAEAMRGDLLQREALRGELRQRQLAGAVASGRARS